MVPSIQYAPISRMTVGYSYLGDLSEHTDVESFKQFCQSEPAYSLNLTSFDNVLSRSAMLGNTEIVAYIVNLKGKGILNIGDEYGITLLFYCVRMVRSSSCYMSERAKVLCPILCSLGANPNLAISERWENNPKRATPLWVAAEKTKCLDLVKMLRTYGAVVYLPLSKKGKNMINRADKEICTEMFNENKELIQAMLFDKQCSFSKLPEDVLILIMAEKLKCKWGLFLLKC